MGAPVTHFLRETTRPMTGQTKCAASVIYCPCRLLPLLFTHLATFKLKTNCLNKIFPHAAPLGPTKNIVIPYDVCGILFRLCFNLRAFCLVLRHL